MRFQLAFRYVFERRGGFANLLMVTVCLLIPIVGPIVLFGYRAEVAVALDRDPEMRRHPKFDFNRFAAYLTRGIWPFLINFIMGILNVPIVMAIVIFVTAINPPGQNNPPILDLLIIAAVEVLALVALHLMDLPLVFHAEITGRLEVMEALRFAADFWKRVGLVALGTGLVYLFISSLIVVLGLLCCFVGVYPAIALNEMAGQHLMCQLYRLYLYRGGEPLIEYRPDRFEDDDYESERERFYDKRKKFKS